MVLNLDHLEVYSLVCWLEGNQIEIDEKNNFLLHDQIHRILVLGILVLVNVLRIFQAVMKNDRSLHKPKCYIQKQNV